MQTFYTKGWTTCWIIYISTRASTLRNTRRNAFLRNSSGQNYTPCTSLCTPPGWLARFGHEAQTTQSFGHAQGTRHLKRKNVGFVAQLPDAIPLGARQHPVATATNVP